MLASPNHSSTSFYFKYHKEEFLRLFCYFADVDLNYVALLPSITLRTPVLCLLILIRGVPSLQSTRTLDPIILALINQIVCAVTDTRTDPVDAKDATQASGGADTAHGSTYCDTGSSSSVYDENCWYTRTREMRIIQCERYIGIISQWHAILYYAYLFVQLHEYSSREISSREKSGEYTPECNPWEYKSLEASAFIRGFDKLVDGLFTYTLISLDACGVSSCKRLCSCKAGQVFYCIV